MPINLNKYFNKFKNKPIIGIVPPPMINDDPKHFLYLNQGYINYFKKIKLNFVIIPYNISLNRMNDYFNNIEGIFISGARIGNYNKTEEFIQQYERIDYILKKVLEMNKTGRIFPLFASCHGIQSIIKTTENKIHNFKVFKRLDAVNYKAKLDFINNNTNNIIKYKNYNCQLAQHNCTFGITPKMFNRTKKLKKMYNIVAVARDRRNKKFVDFIKHKTYPIYAFQFHPEKSITGLLDEYIEGLYKSKNIRDKNNIGNIKFKPNMLDYKTYTCKKLRPRVINVHKSGLKKTSKKSTKCHIIKIT